MVRVVIMFLAAVILFVAGRENISVEQRQDSDSEEKEE